MVEVSGTSGGGEVRMEAGLTVRPGPDEKFLLPDTFLDYALITRLMDRNGERRSSRQLRKIVVERDDASDVP